MTLRRRGIAALAALCAVITAGTVLLTAHPAAAANTAYVMALLHRVAATSSAANYGLHLAVSRDGLNWTPLNQNNPVVTPTAGTLGLRDPFVLRKQDGTFVVLATDLNGTDFSQNNQYLHVWDSTDLTQLHRLPPDPDAHPEHAHLGADGVLGRRARPVRHRLLGQQRHRRVHGQLHLGLPDRQRRTQVFFSPGLRVLDGDIVRRRLDLLPVLQEPLQRAALRRPVLAPARRTATPPTPAGCGRATPSRRRCWSRTTSGSGWRLWGDSFSPVNNDYYAWSTTNVGANSWTALNQRDYTPPMNAKHGSIVGITRRRVQRPASPAGARRTGSG